MSSWGKGILIAAVAIATLAAATPRAEAILFGQISSAQSLESGSIDAGAFVSVFEHATVLFGQYRQGLWRNGDFGIQAGFVDPEGGDVGLALGGDLKFWVMSVEKNTPFDLAIQPRVGYFGMDNVSVFTLGASAVISRDYGLSQGSLTPYGAINMRVEHFSFDNAVVPVTLSAKASSGGDDSNFEIGAIAGLKWDVSKSFDILGEVVLDDDIGLTVGLNFKL